MATTTKGISASITFALATALLVARPLIEGFYFRAFSRRITPTTVGYNYIAKLRIAMVRLTPTRPADSFAALAQSLHLRCSLLEKWRLISDTIRRDRLLITTHYVFYSSAGLWGVAEKSLGSEGIYPPEKPGTPFLF